MPVVTFPVTLQKAYMLTPSVKHFVFSANQEFNHIPGQFITIHFEVDNKILRRSYSIANIPQNNSLIEFSAGYVKDGPGTKLLFNLKPGDSINVNGPFGRLVLKDEDPKRYIFVATSTGVTPFRSMLAEIKQKLINNPSLEIVILQGVQKREDLLFGDEFLNFSKEHPQVEFRAHYSRENDTTLLEYERLGYVQKSFDDLALNPETDLVYLCGNPQMIDEAFNHLKDKNFEIKQVVREKYISGK